MICLNCQTPNNENSKACISCGKTFETLANSQSLETNIATNIVNEPIDVPQPVNVQQPVQAQNTVLNVQQPVHSHAQTIVTNTQQSIQTQVQPVVTNTQQAEQIQNQNIAVNNQQVESLNYFEYLISVLIKPFQTFKNSESKLLSIKNSLILTSIISIAMMLISLFKAMISSVFVKDFDLSTFEYKTTFKISNLKELDYLSLIGKNLLIYVGIILVIATVYYLASLVCKKQTSFSKLLSITVTSVFPFVILGMIVAPLLGKIWNVLTIVLMIAGGVYTLTIFAFLIKEEIRFEKQDLGIYFHLSCMTILGTAGYYVYIKMLTSNITNQIGNIMDMFG